MVVVDYGLGNLLSVRRGFESAGASVGVSADPAVILSAPRVVLPGVGAFGRGMAELRAHGLDRAVLEVARKGTPLLGICLGMQMLFETSEEFGLTDGLGLIPGRVVSVPDTDEHGAPVKIPHIGWSPLLVAGGRDDWAGTALADVRPGDACYFVHSFMGEPADLSHRVADCAYGGRPIAAAVQKENVHGCQFHPEKSGPVGLAILKRFVQS